MWSRYRPGVAQRVGRGIALLFHDRGTRRGWVVSSTARPHFTLGKELVPILQEAVWAPGPVWTGGKSRPYRDSIPDRPARSSVAIPTELPGPRSGIKHHSIPNISVSWLPKNKRKIRIYEARILIILESARNFNSDPKKETQEWGSFSCKDPEIISLCKEQSKRNILNVDFKELILST